MLSTTSTWQRPSIQLTIILCIVIGLIAIAGPAQAQTLPAKTNQGIENTVHILYFYSTECTHCKAIEEEILTPLTSQYGAQLDIQKIDVSDPANYEMLIHIEDLFDISQEERGIPTLVIGDQILIGESPIREKLVALVEKGIAEGGVALPNIPTPAAPALPALPGTTAGTGEICEADSSDACGTAAPIWGAYFYQVGCQECSRVKMDMQYIQSRYPQFVIEEFNLYDNMTLAQWLAGRLGREQDVHAPALFIGDAALIGDEEITPEKLESLMETYAATGAEKVWADFDATQAQAGLIARFQSLGPVAVALAGLIDGLNPCAFATLIFFVSYLTLSGRKGREVLIVGAAFTLGVFTAYSVIGLGFYKVLDLLGDILTTLGRWVYALTAIFCAGLAIFSFKDFIKARRGQIGDMNLNLPHALRMRINTVIRKGKNTQTYVLGAFLTGLVISFLELACTGQVYLPTIIFVTSVPELQAQAMLYLGLYNLLFIVPLIIVFILAYYGTTSKELTRFLQKNTAMVKLGMVVLFTSMAIWLGASLV